MSYSLNSSGSWAGVRILAVQSVNSGLESFAKSPARAIDTVSISQPAPIAAMARTSDWVQEQSTQGQTITPKVVAQCVQPVTPPRRSISCENQDGDVESHQAALSIGLSHSKLVYSIPTLLSMRHMQRAVPIMLRVKPEAIAGECHDLPTLWYSSYLRQKLTDPWQRTSFNPWEWLVRGGCPLALVASPTYPIFPAVASYPTTLIIAHPSDPNS